jgi:hypothetical protein
MIFKKIKSSKFTSINLIFLLLAIFALIIGSFIFLQKTQIKYKTKANVCGCQPGGSCSLNGEYCENFHHCEGTDPIFEVYICSNRKWEYAYPQRGGACSSNCGATPIIFPTQPDSCPCVGGLYNVVFKTTRPLRDGEYINCTISGSGPCSCNGNPCSSGHRERSCGIGPGLSQCGVSGLDCYCAPFTYNCTGTGSASGTFSSVTNGGSDEVIIPLPEIPLTPPPEETPTPTPSPTSSPTPTPTQTLTPTQTPTPPPTETPTPPLSETPTPTETPTPPPTETPQPTETPTQTPPTSTPTQTPTPTEIVLASTVPTTTPTNTPSQPPPQSGGVNFLIVALPLLIIIASLIL